LIRCDDFLKQRLLIADEHGAIIHDGTSDHVGRPIDGASIGIDQDRPPAGEVFRQPGHHGPYDMADGLGIVITRNPDENLCFADLGNFTFGFRC